MLNLPYPGAVYVVRVRVTDHLWRSGWRSLSPRVALPVLRALDSLHYPLSSGTCTEHSWADGSITRIIANPWYT